MRGKVVLITGASSGIGAGTAVHFSAQGCLLALTGRSQSGLQDTQQACIQAGAKEDDILLISCDLLVIENLTMIVEKTIGKFGRLDVLVNNAGMSILGRIMNTSNDMYNTIMNTNVKSVFFLTQAALPYLIETKGNVVNVSSVASVCPGKLSIVYNMSKASLDHFTRSLALDVAAKGVRVNSVIPGPVRTPIFEKFDVVIDIEDFATKCTAIKRAGTVKEIAKAIGFLADDEQSSFITGMALLIDGGFVLRGPI